MAAKISRYTVYQMVILVHHYCNFILMHLFANLHDEMEVSFAVTCGHPAWNIQQYQIMHYTVD